MRKQYFANSLTSIFFLATTFLSSTAMATLVPLPSVLDYTNGDEQLNRRLQLAFKAGVEQYADDIEKSELVGNSTETNTEISLVWH